MDQTTYPPPRNISDEASRYRQAPSVLRLVHRFYLYVHCPLNQRGAKQLYRVHHSDGDGLRLEPWNYFSCRFRSIVGQCGDPTLRRAHLRLAGWAKSTAVQHGCSRSGNRAAKLHVQLHIFGTCLWCGIWNRHERSFLVQYHGVAQPLVSPKSRYGDGDQRNGTGCGRPIDGSLGRLSDAGDQLAYHLGDSGYVDLGIGRADSLPVLAQ